MLPLLGWITLLTGLIDASASPEEKRRLANEWCDTFQKRTDRFLKSTIASFDEQGEPTLSFEDVDTSLIPPRPRLYGLVGAEVIEEVWKERAAKHATNGAPTRTPATAAAT